MKALLVSMTISLGLIAASSAQAQAPAAAPAGSTGMCKDGTYSSADAKKGACRGHKGVKEWYAASAAAPAANDAASPAAEKKSKSKATADAPAAAPAATAAAAPAGSTGMCKDGTYSSADAKKGACRGHKGVKDWYGPAAAAAAPAAMPAAAAPKAAPAPAPMPAARPASPPMAATPAASSAPAAGGGNGKVWVNTESKVYHCQDDRYYGKTKQGEYMSEADAIAKGDHASHGKACSK